MSLPALHMVTQLWGQHYIDLFANTVIPSLLAPGNLPALSGAPASVYEIHTTAEDRRRLEAQPGLARLRSVLEGWAELRFVEIEGDIENPYRTMSDCHRRAIAAAEARGAALLFLQPDVLVGPGSLATVRDKLEQGCRLVLAPGLRAVREALAPLFAAGAEVGSDAAPSTRALVAAALRNLHPISEALLWERGTVGSYCSHLYWRIGDHALYARCAHMHPLMVCPAVEAAGFDHTIDWDYFYRACPDPGTWFVAASSDEVCLVELSDREKFADALTPVDATPRTVGRFFAQATEAPHRELVKRPYLFLGRDLAEDDWSRCHREAGEVVARALRYYGRPGIVRFFEDPVLVLAPIAQRFSNVDDRLRRFRGRHPIVGLPIYGAYRGLYHGVRPVYRLVAGRRRARPALLVRTAIWRVACRMSDARVPLARLKSRRPMIGRPVYWSYLGVYVALRPVYRMIERLQR